jgi:hypothetical protein
VKCPEIIDPAPRAVPSGPHGGAFLILRIINMQTLCPHRRTWVALVAIVWSGFLGAGCSGSRNAPVDAAKARETLRAVLDSWKRGDKMDALQSAAPPIYVNDPDWQSGAVLSDYQITGDGQEMDAQLFCPATLRVQLPNGQEVKRDVTYIISTAPNLTVNRKIF